MKLRSGSNFVSIKRASILDAVEHKKGRVVLPCERLQALEGNTQDKALALELARGLAGELALD